MSLTELLSQVNCSKGELETMKQHIKGNAKMYILYHFLSLIAAYTKIGTGLSKVTL